MDDTYNEELGVMTSARVQITEFVGYLEVNGGRPGRVSGMTASA